MFDFIGKVLSAPVRILNVPVKIVAKVADEMTGGPSARVRDYDPLALDEVADAIEDEISD